MILFVYILSIFSVLSPGIHDDLKASQIVIVRTSSWNSIQGELNTYEWKNGKWMKAGDAIQVVTGRSGLAWGNGLHDRSFIRGKIKKEGDGNAPAGIYRLSGLFSYVDVSEKMSSLKVDNRTFCVDDRNSKYYNTIVHADTAAKDWNSAETMRMKTDVYKDGIFVDYNTQPVVPGKGSCIFIHIWSGSNAPTSGCTAMTETNILKLIKFLDPSKNPLLVQLPDSEYPAFRKRYGLP